MTTTQEPKQTALSAVMRRAQDGRFLTGAEAAQVRDELIPDRCREAPLNKVPNDLRKAAKFARKSGFAIWMDGRGHLVFCNPHGETATIAATGKKNGHAGMNYKVQLRRIGVPLV